jgi:hypothetical protein
MDDHPRAARPGQADGLMRRRPLVQQPRVQPAGQPPGQLAARRGGEARGPGGRAVPQQPRVPGAAVRGRKDRGHHGAVELSSGPAGARLHTRRQRLARAALHPGVRGAGRGAEGPGRRGRALHRCRGRQRGGHGLRGVDIVGPGYRARRRAGGHPGRPSLHHVHVRDHRQAQGRRPHARQHSLERRQRDTDVLAIRRRHHPGWPRRSST